MAGTKLFIISAFSSPTIIQGPLNVTTIEGQNISISCNVSGDPTPSVEWYKDNQLLTISGRITRQNNDTITITNLKRTDEGLYYCNATNNVSSVSSPSAAIIVNCK